MTEAVSTDDVVARIRKHEGAYLFPKTADSLLEEAAIEIERLRKRVDDLHRELREETRAVADERSWQHRQGEDYGSY